MKKTNKIYKYILFIIVGGIIISIVYSKSGAKEIPILLYHHILKEEENILYTDNGAVISYENFYEQMKYLYDNNYNIITFNELEEFIYKKKKLPKKSVIITFDDGYLSNYRYAYEIIKEFNFRGSIFLVTDMILDKNVEFDANKLDMLSWQDILVMGDVFEFYSHTHDMHKFNDDKPMLVAASANSIIQDIEKSFSYPISKKIFSYPFGAYESHTVNLLRDYGIKLAVTVNPGYVDYESSPLELNRFVIYPETTMETFIKIVRGDLK